jgi:hypothetical protein
MILFPTPETVSKFDLHRDSIVQGATTEILTSGLICPTSINLRFKTDFFPIHGRPAGKK